MPICWITCQNFRDICLFFFAEFFFITIFSIFDESGPKTVEIFRQKLMKKYYFFYIANTKLFFGMILETPRQKQLLLIYNLFLNYYEFLYSHRRLTRKLQFPKVSVGVQLFDRGKIFLKIPTVQKLGCLTRFRVGNYRLISEIEFGKRHIKFKSFKT